MHRTITPREAKGIVHGGAEMALLDVREHGQYVGGHPLFCTPCPYSRLETLAQRLVPSTNGPVLLLDGGTAFPSERQGGSRHWAMKTCAS